MIADRAAVLQVEKELLQIGSPLGTEPANPGITTWQNTALTFVYAIPILFLGLHYMNLVPTAHGNFILRNTFARRTEFRSDGFVEYVGEQKSE